MGLGGDAKELTKLPILLQASPGNIGVQIDSYRTKDIFNRPRSNRFTTAFHGIMYEDHRLHNADRMNQREIQRKQYARLREEKLAAYEQQRREAQLRVEEKRKHREYLRKQRLWEHQQALKAEWERQLENYSASRIQALYRGMAVRRKLTAQHAAATQIQAHVRRISAQRQYIQNRQELLVLQQNRCATRIQAQVKGHLSRKKYCKPKQINTPCEEKSREEIPSVIPPEFAIDSKQEMLLNTSDEPSNAKEDETRIPLQASSSQNLTPKPPEKKRPFTTVLKRVGGGFRKVIETRNLKPTTAPSPRRPSPRPVPSPKTWNTISNRPWPQPKAIQTFIQDPNLAEKFNVILPKSESQAYSQDDVFALSDALHQVDCTPECLDDEIKQAVQSEQQSVFECAPNPIEITEWSELLDEDNDARASSSDTKTWMLMFQPSELSLPIDTATEAPPVLNYSSSSDEQLRAVDAYSWHRSDSNVCL